MALIFQRLAQNFIKNGYFPTDSTTLTRILSAIEGEGRAAILDPCCGEGTALAELRAHLAEQDTQVAAYGVEFDAERAWHAKGILDTVIHADINDVVIGARTIGALFLNPPYGDALADRGQLSTGASGRQERLEKQFYRLAVPWLMFGGIMVLIVPHYVLDAEFASLIARHFHQVRVFLAPEQRFKQIVLFGVKRRADVPDSQLAKKLEAIGRGELPAELPQEWNDHPYVIPACGPDLPKFQAIKIDQRQLLTELGRLGPQTLWPQFDRQFACRSLPHRRPLCTPSDWHLALALAAGQLSGVVTSDDGRILLITGDTYKEKTNQTQFEEDENGDVTEIRTLTDRFVPVITAIDFTPGPGYGDIVTIR